MSASTCDLIALLAEADAVADPSVPADRLANGGALIQRLARALKESKAEAATLRAVSRAADDRLTEALTRHMLHDDGRGWSWERAAKVLDARADEAATLKAERDRLTGAEMRERIVQMLIDRFRRQNPSIAVRAATLHGPEACAVADAIMSLLKGEGRQ